MAYKDCISEIMAAAGRQLSDDELDTVLTQLNRRTAEKRKARQGAAAEPEVLAAADDYARDMAETAVIEKRNAAINLRRRLEAVDFIRTNFANDPALGVEALLVGVNRPVPGARRSVAQEQNQLRNYDLAGLFSEIEKQGLWKAMVSGAMDREIAQAMWAMNREIPQVAAVPKEAVQIAEAISKWQDVARRDANAAGAWIKRLEGYITRQSHDASKLLAAGFEKWKAAIENRLDWDRTMPEGGNRDELLKGAYEGLASGIHLKSGDSEPTGFKGPQNLARKLSAERVLHFRSADDWFDYNQAFGAGTLRDSIVRSFEIAAQGTGLMRRLGTNPQTGFSQITSEVMAGMEPAAKKKFNDAVRGKLTNQLRTVDGTTRIPVNHLAATIGSSVRAQQSMAKLGGALMSQFSDLPLYGSELRYQGRSMLGGIAEGVSALFKGRNRAEMAEIDGMLGVVMDSMSGQVTARFSVADDDLPGAISKAQQLFFKWNGMQWWTDTLRSSVMRGMSHHLALNAGKTWAELGADFQRVLSLSKIEEKQWNTIRKAQTVEADGKAYLTPERVEAVGGRDLADAVRSYLVDRATYAVTNPTQRTEAWMRQGTQPGTLAGETLRYIGQFKSFPVSVIEKAIGREIYGRGANTLGEALRNGNGEMTGIAQLILWTTAFGYVSMAAKDIVKGRAPRDPDDPRTWAAAMAQGGGAGIFGDFLFGEMRNRFGGGLLSTVAGPTFGTVDDLADIFGRLKAGDDTAAASFRLLVSNMPGLNLFYAKMAFEYLVLNRIQEWLNPGSLKRLEKRIQKENGEKFLIRPSQLMAG